MKIYTRLDNFSNLQFSISVVVLSIHSFAFIPGRKKRGKKLDQSRSATLSRISNFESIDASQPSCFRLGSIVDEIPEGPSSLCAKGARLFGRGHQRAPSKRPVCNYRHEAWPRGRTIGPLFIFLPLSTLQTRWDLRSARFTALLRSHLFRRGISIGYRSPIRRF